MAKRIYITESQLKSITESAQDIEYHYTSLDGLCGMMETDTFNLTKNDERNRYGKHFMSLSRVRSSLEGYGKGFTFGDCPIVRIELNGKAVNNIRNVNIKPYNYFNNVVLPDMQEMPELFAGRDERTDFSDGIGYSEFEDSLTLKDGSDQVKDAIDCINRIDILLKERIGENISEWSRFLDHFNTYRDWAQKMHFFTNMNDFNYQKNEIPAKEIYGFYSNQMKQALEENKQKMGKRIYITESQLDALLEKKKMIDEHIAIIDNSKDVEKLISMQWTSPDDYWFIQVTQRKKDFRSYNKRHGGTSKWWKRVQGVDGTSRENFAGYGIVMGNTLQDAIDCLHNIEIHLNPWAAQAYGQKDVKSNGNMEAIYDICDKLWARAYITINKRSYSRSQRLASKSTDPRAFEKESSRNHRDPQCYGYSMIDMDIDHPGAESETDTALQKLGITPAIKHASHDGVHYFFKNRDIMNYTEHSPEFSPIARKYAASKQPGEAFTMKYDAKMIIYSPCGQ